MRGDGPLNPLPEDAAAHDFETLLISHQHRIYFFIRTMVFNPDDARDVLQDVNAVIIRKRGQFMPGSDFKSWSFAIARFECLTYLRRHEAKRAASASEEFLMHLAEGAETKADESEGWLEALAECRKLLPEESARLLQLRYQARVPLEEIAPRWQTTEGALKQKLFRIRAQLKNCILKRRSAAEGDKETFEV
ncbi:sigma-70 family RNA polymerase sigma factor [Luteolibacter sp. GHJ8]|uniref:Sigma-70 family RNA polymerase sigma factor n=1 Tax=Luteolibacter rhizosphaerae TaxID=2989719 RepID=A0ABT3G1Z6_9BACT|nr:sigma-70 family RNA polymerase sigma factor [Luteolibacter rhizosphaerae]MCW1913855.1 sigma-70 family RNA polymerase sigma factor [Luteolibacter rhizosphaerae]